MKRLNDGLDQPHDPDVEFESDDEAAAAQFFDTCLANGVSVSTAVDMVRMCTRFVNLDEDFFTWLGE